mmetsp:Transcript_965/g.2706  ORF Transcript_965/g.2706 Transcript_965/m.2706 type:complete len:335 (+) Transcript_965:3890-4894(+)
MMGCLGLVVGGVMLPVVPVPVPVPVPVGGVAVPVAVAVLPAGDVAALDGGVDLGDIPPGFSPFLESVSDPAVPSASASALAGGVEVGTAGVALAAAPAAEAASSSASASASASASSASASGVLACGGADDVSVSVSISVSSDATDDVAADAVSLSSLSSPASSGSLSPFSPLSSRFSSNSWKCARHIPLQLPCRVLGQLPTRHMPFRRLLPLPPDADAAACARLLALAAAAALALAALLRFSSISASLRNASFLRRSSSSSSSFMLGTRTVLGSTTSWNLYTKPWGCPATGRGRLCGGSRARSSPLSSAVSGTASKAQRPVHTQDPADVAGTCS